MSQRDVPGVTRGIVPVMRKSGLIAFTEGCNAQIEGPEAPGPIFNWTDKDSGASVLMLLHPRGYGIAVDADADTETGIGIDADSAGDGGGEEVGVSIGDPCPTRRDVVAVDGFNEALVYAFKDDNRGPPTPDEVAKVLNCTGKLFPTTPAPQFVGSTYDDFVRALLAHPTAAASLPVVTSEIGYVSWYSTSPAQFLTPTLLFALCEHTPDQRRVDLWRTV